VEEQAEAIRNLVLAATRRARLETSEYPWPELAGHVDWPLPCIVGLGLEGAIACESSVGYVNGTRGMLVYRGYDIFDLCAHSSFEEVAYLLLHGSLPGPTELARFHATLAGYRYLPRTLRRLMSFPVENMKPMASLRLGTNLSHQEFTLTDQQTQALDPSDFIGTDEDDDGGRAGEDGGQGLRPLGASLPVLRRRKGSHQPDPHTLLIPLLAESVPLPRLPGCCVRGGDAPRQAFDGPADQEGEHKSGQQHQRNADGLDNDPIVVLCEKGLSFTHCNHMLSICHEPAHLPGTGLTDLYVFFILPISAVAVKDVPPAAERRKPNEAGCFRGPSAAWHRERGRNASHDHGSGEGHEAQPPHRSHAEAHGAHRQ